jgi:hypothetical protein
VISTLLETWDTDTELSPFLEGLSALLDSTGEKVFYISDVSRVQASLQDMLVVANRSSRGEGAVLHHPNIQPWLCPRTRCST